MKKILLSLIIGISCTYLMGRPGSSHMGYLGPSSNNQIIPFNSTSHVMESPKDEKHNALNNCLQDCNRNPVMPAIRFLADIICLPFACIARPCKDRGPDINDGFFYWTRALTCDGDHTPNLTCCNVNISTSSEDCCEAIGLDCCTACEDCCDCCCDCDC